MLCGKTHSFNLALKCLDMFHHQDTMSKQLKWKLYKMSRLLLIQTKFPWFVSRLQRKRTWSLTEKHGCTFVSHSCGCQLTAKMLSSTGQQAVEDVEGSFIFGLSYGPRLLQEIFEQKVKDLTELGWSLRMSNIVNSLVKIYCYNIFFRHAVFLSRKRDTSFNIGPYDVSCDIKVDSDKLPLQDKKDVFYSRQHPCNYLV